MIRLFIIAIILFYDYVGYAQELPVVTEQQLENLADQEEGETEDDTFLQELDYFKKNQLNLNTVEFSDLRQLRLLTDLQISNFISYRKLFGAFISIYELQAIPTWNIPTIKKIIPFVTISSAESILGEGRNRLKNGEHSLLFRVSQLLEKQKGFDISSSGTRYLGSPQRFLVRYRYNYKNSLQYGITADKDAGEQFFKGQQRMGFDFYSFHLFARKIGKIQSIAVGDFTVNMGQGLLQWQSLAFKKSADAIAIKRQSAILRPYTSAGEYNFHRGAGITVKNGNVETTLFISLRQISANAVIDTLSNEEYVSSLLTSGYHRTENEITDKNSLAQRSAGGNIVFKKSNWHLGLNGIYFNFSQSINKRNEPYNLYAVNGKSWSNFSFDYSYTYKNFHFFGETAADKNLYTAFVNGLIFSADPRVDFSFLQRVISAGYQSINGNAFTENTYPTNESGTYFGITVRPFIGWRLDAYADYYHFPWLKYRVDAPSYGKDFMSQVIFTPSKKIELYTRFRNEVKQGNQPDNVATTNNLIFLSRKSWRTQINFQGNSSLAFRNRVELLWYNKKMGNAANGFLTYFDVHYKPLKKSFSGIVRFQYFETDDYNARIYAFENDVLYKYSIPAFSDKGFRYYININTNVSKTIRVWFRIAQTYYLNKQSIGSGLDEIAGNKRTEVSFQVRWQPVK